MASRSFAAILEIREPDFHNYEPPPLGRIELETPPFVRYPEELQQNLNLELTLEHKYCWTSEIQGEGHGQYIGFLVTRLKNRD